MTVTPEQVVRAVYRCKGYGVNSSNFCDKFHLITLNLKVLLAGNYMFKVNNRNSRTRCEICSQLTTKTPERRQRRCLYC